MENNMNNTPNDITQEELSLIDQYLHHQLDAEQLKAFEDRRNSDATFNAKVTEVSNLALGIKEISLQNKLKVFHDEMLVEQNGGGKVVAMQRKPSAYKWWAAASVAILIIAASWWLLGSNDNEKLYHAYFVPDIGLPVAMGSADSASYTFYDGMVSYKEEKYADAIRKWESLSNAGRYADTLNYYMGMAMINQGELSKAEPLLAKVIQSPDNPFRSSATWYMALIQLKKNDRAKAATLLKQLPAREEAVKLLKAIE